jgi:uncharacterized membrane protein
MVIALVSFLLGGVAGFVAGIRNAKSSKVAAVEQAITNLKK